jgi:hypothetical protein
MITESHWPFTPDKMLIQSRHHVSGTTRTIGAAQAGKESDVSPAIDRLTRLMPPPAGAGDRVDWAAVEREWDCVFPQDFKEFTAVYGCGEIGGYLSVASPTPLPSGPASIDIGMLTPNADSLQTLAEMTGMQSSPYSALPAADGLIGWGVTPGGDTAFWRRDPEPERWHVVVWARHPGNNDTHWFEYDSGLVEFLVADLEQGQDAASRPWTALAPDFKHWRTSLDEFRLRTGTHPDSPGPSA